MAPPNNGPLQYAISVEMDSLKGTIKEFNSHMGDIDKSMKAFGDSIEKSMERVNKSILGVNANFKKLADTAKETSSSFGEGGGFLGGGVGGNLLGGFLGAVKSVISTAIGAALDFGVSSIKKGAAWDDSFRNIGRMSPLGRLNSKSLQNELTYMTDRANEYAPGTWKEEVLDVHNIYAQLGKARMDTSMSKATQMDRAAITRESIMGGRATGMGTGRTAEVLMEQNRSLGQTIPQLQKYNNLMMAVSRVSGMTAEQMSDLNDKIVAMGVNYGKSGKEAAQFAQEAVVVGGRMAEMGYNVTDMLGKMSQQATGSEYGVIQSLLLGGPAGDVSKRWGATQDAMKSLREMAAGLPEEFREYFIKQASPVFGLQGFSVSDIMRTGQFKDQTAFTEAGRKERLDKGMGTDNDYLKQIADAAKDPAKFYNSIKQTFDKLASAVDTMQTRLGTGWGSQIANIINGHWGQIKGILNKVENFLKKIKLDEIFNTLFNWLKEFIANPLETIRDLLIAIAKKIKDPLGSAFDAWSKANPNVTGYNAPSPAAKITDKGLQAVMTFAQTLDPSAAATSLFKDPYFGSLKRGVFSDKQFKGRHSSDSELMESFANATGLFDRSKLPKDLLEQEMLKGRISKMNLPDQLGSRISNIATSENVAHGLQQATSTPLSPMERDYMLKVISDYIKKNPQDKDPNMPQVVSAPKQEQTLSQIERQLVMINQREELRSSMQGPMPVGQSWSNVPLQFKASH